MGDGIFHHSDIRGDIWRFRAMISLLKDWEGEVEIDGVKYESISDVSESTQNTLNPNTVIKLSSKKKRTLTERQSIVKSDDNGEQTITVRAYMTKHATPDFNFMAQWNNDIPMPMRTMQGEKIKETRGMVYMKLHGYGKATITCLCCGKELTNPISRHYGIGPVCLSKIGITRDIEDVSGIREELQNITWEGWIIKSAILKEGEVEE